MVPRPARSVAPHNGVISWMSCPSFPRNVLEVMRQPLEDVSGFLYSAHHAGDLRTIQYTEARL